MLSVAPLQCLDLGDRAELLLEKDVGDADQLVLRQPAGITQPRHEHLAVVCTVSLGRCLFLQPTALFLRLCLLSALGLLLTPLRLLLDTLLLEKARAHQGRIAQQLQDLILILGRLLH